MLRAGAAIFLLLACDAAAAAAPKLYSHAAFQGPVRAEPNDLLLLSGAGLAASDTVVYQAAAARTAALARPTDPMPASTADSGVAPVVSSANVPHALTIRMPEAIRAGQTYALWVRNRAGEWSEPVWVNDPRPLWVTPAYAYESAAFADLPRSIKLVGRNLQPTPGQVARLRLTGPEVVTVPVVVTRPAIDGFAARAFLPPVLMPGNYSVAFSRDDTNWVTLESQAFEVRPDPIAQREYAVGDRRFGDCRPDDGLDDTPCILKALAAAALQGNALVRFGAGTWDIIDGNQPGLAGGDGILVPAGVSLQGAGSALTRIVRHARWNVSAPVAAFSLAGHNTVDGFRFHDEQVYVASDRAGPFLQLGENSDRVWALRHGAQPAVAEVIVTRNVFDRTHTAIADGGQPLARVFIVHNEFGAYNFGLQLGGNRYNVARRFRVADSVIAFNTFKPGSYVRPADRQGAIASEIGASRRLDFSDNVADGTSAEYLYSSADAHGWRAGFFWHMNDSHEMLLVSGNVVSCAGDKPGDGESFAFDNNGNTFAFDSARVVLAGSGSGVTVAGPLIGRQSQRDIAAASYYVGHWLQIVEGPGRGQARRIVGYGIEPGTGRVAFRVAPDWDVPPAAKLSRISVGREFWQVYLVGNRVDDRAPPCRKSNTYRPIGGSIGLWAQISDSVVEGNELYDTDGIVFQPTYQPPERDCPDCYPGFLYQSFLDIRANLIDGKYDWSSDCSASGIKGWISAAPWGRGTPPTVAYGIAISHNRIEHADNSRGGAINVELSWHPGPAPYKWALMDNLLVFGNSIIGQRGPVASKGCGPFAKRTGLSLPASDLVWRSVFYGNQCEASAVPMGPVGATSVLVCPSPVGATSCECATQPKLRPP